MKIGRKVWFEKKGKLLSAELLEFGKGEMALVRMEDGTEREVRKIFLLGKKPKQATSDIAGG